MINLGDLIEKFIPQLKEWMHTHYFHLALFNIILIILVLLRSAGYFEPYLPITIHTIVLISLLLLVFLLGVNSKVLFSITLLLWLFASLLGIVGIAVWAERTAVYAYEALVIAVILFAAENMSSGK